MDDAGSGSSAVDDYDDVSMGNLLLYPFSFLCIRCLTVLIFVEVEAI